MALYANGNKVAPIIKVQKEEQSKTLTLGASAPQTVTPDANKVLSSVPVSIDNTVIKADNIAQGVTMLGITGTHSGGVTPTGTINITDDGITDVTNYANANVTATQYNVQWRNILPDVDANGKLDAPSLNISTQIIFSGVKELGIHALRYRFYGNNSVTAAQFPDLEEISGSSALQCAFEYSRMLSVDFPKLERITGNNACVNAFNQTYVRTISFPKLNTISGSGCMQSFIPNTSQQLQTVYFYKLNNESFADVSSPLSGFLGSNQGVTVHCQPGLNAISKNHIQSMGGTGTVFLYDLGGTVNFTVTPSTAQEYMYNEEVLNHTCLAQADVTSLYEIYDSANNVLLIDSVSNVVLDESQTVTKDLSTGYHQIKLSMSSEGQTVGGLNTTISTTDGATFDMATDTDGSKVINQISPVNTPLYYYVDGGDSYSDEDGYVYTNNEDVTQSITLSPAQWNTFVRPDLTSNGTLGGNEFAVWANSYVSGYEAYRAVDDGATTYWGGMNTSNNAFIFYNPMPLKISTLVFTFSSTSYRMAKMTIWGSNDNETYTDLTGELTNSAATFTATVNNTTPYKYFKITYTQQGTYVRLRDIVINATYKGRS